MLYQNPFKPDQFGKSNNAASSRITTRPVTIDPPLGPMAKHATINKSAPLTTDEEITKTRAVVSDVGGTKSAANEKRVEKCKEKCPANIKECCRNAIAGIKKNSI